MIGITFVPIVVLIITNAVYVKDGTVARRSLESVKDVIKLSIDDYGGLVHYLQIERGKTALFISSRSSELFEDIQDQYRSTDGAIANISIWNPGDSNDASSNPIPSYFETKATFQKHLENYRDMLDPNTTTLYDVMGFYTEGIQVIINSFVDFKVDTSHDILRQLVTFELLVLTKEQNGVKRALGSSFYASGGFRNHSSYLWFIKENNYGNAFLASSIFYTATVEARYHELLDSEASLLPGIQVMEEEIMLNDLENLTPSQEQASNWFSHMTRYLDILSAMQRGVADDILEDLDRAIAYRTTESIFSIIIFIAVLLISPVIIQAIVFQTKKIQMIGDNLQSKTHELEVARDRADDLLHQMLPPVVARELMTGGSAHAEFYEDATIFYSTVVEFTSMCAKSSPMQVGLGVYLHLTRGHWFCHAKDY